MTDTITREAAEAAMREIVASKPEGYVYPRVAKGGGSGSCVYAENDGTPSCIVGHVVAKLAPETFAAWVAYEATDAGTFGIMRAEGGSDDRDDFRNDPTQMPPTLNATSEAFKFLQKAQQEQDLGATWLEALNEAGA